jgi:hypothetical protein
MRQQRLFRTLEDQTQAPFNTSASSVEIDRAAGAIDDVCDPCHREGGER